jgi:hypothetical protein
MRAADAFAIFESPSFDSREVFSFNVSLAGKYYLRVFRLFSGGRSRLYHYDIPKQSINSNSVHRLLSL